mmetsp:Transcript_37494/g.82477  ORF Transcript_37494/g.82477 Transcript_37494/m.82477 type:complete len:178 (-) Transcript_37494:390-923(-)
MGFAKKSNRSAPTGPPMQRPSPTPSATRSNVAAPSYRPASSVAAPPPPKATSSPVPPPPSNHGSNASTHHAPPPAHQPHTASAPPAAQSSGPGLMGTFASSAAGSVAGSMIANTLFGGSRTPEAAKQEAMAPPTSSGTPVCTYESQQFLQCMSMNNDDLNQCQQLFDAYKHCSAQVA